MASKTESNMEALNRDVLDFIDYEFKNPDLKNNPEMVVAITELYKVVIEKSITNQKHLEEKNFKEVLDEALNELSDRINHLH